MKRKEDEFVDFSKKKKRKISVGTKKRKRLNTTESDEPPKRKKREETPSRNINQKPNSESKNMKPKSCICPTEGSKSPPNIKGPHMRALSHNGSAPDLNRKPTEFSKAEEDANIASAMDTAIQNESGEESLMDKSSSSNLPSGKPSSCICPTESVRAEESKTPLAAAQNGTPARSINTFPSLLNPIVQSEPSENSLAAEDTIHPTSEIDFLKPTIVAALIPSIILPSLFLWQEDLDWISVFGIPSWVFQTIFYTVCYISTLVLISTWVVEFDLSPALKREFVHRVSRFLFGINIGVCVAVFFKDASARGELVRRRATPLFLAYILSFICFSVAVNKRLVEESQRGALILSILAFFFCIYPTSVADSILIQTMIFFFCVDLILFYSLLKNPQRSRAEEDKLFKWIAVVTAIVCEHFFPMWNQQFGSPLTTFETTD